MAKYFGFINNQDERVDYLAASDTEKTAIDNSVSAPLTWLTVSDEDFAKIHDSTHDGYISGGAMTFDVTNDGSFESSQEVVQEAINYDVATIDAWLKTPRANVNTTLRNEWQTYRDALAALDLSTATTTFPCTGTSVLKTLADNGDIPAYRNIKRLN